MHNWFTNLPQLYYGNNTIYNIVHFISAVLISVIQIAQLKLYDINIFEWNIINALIFIYSISLFMHCFLWNALLKGGKGSSS